MSWAEHAACMRSVIMYTYDWSECMKETDHLGGEGAIKMDLLETVYEDVD
jgi:hypothetical protein